MLELLQAYDWPKNARKLQNVMEEALMLFDGDTLAVDEAWLQHKSPRLQEKAWSAHRWFGDCGEIKKSAEVELTP